MNKNITEVMKIELPWNTTITKHPVFEAALSAFYLPAPILSLAQTASMFALMHYVGDLELGNILAF